MAQDKQQEQGSITSITNYDLYLLIHVLYIEEWDKTRQVQKQGSTMNITIDLTYMRV